jgi:hypothetical protein
MVSLLFSAVVDILGLFHVAVHVELASAFVAEPMLCEATQRLCFVKPPRGYALRSDPESL